MKNPSHIDEDRQSLWLMIISPTVWAAHFLLSYLAGALGCGLGAASLGQIQTAIAVLALTALVAIAFNGWYGWQRHSQGHEAPPHDADSPEDRHRFLGLATVLLSALSAIATVFVTVSVLLVRACA